MFPNSIIAWIAAAAAAYLLGSVSGAIVASWTRHKEDIRNFGSGNAGMTNALRTYGVRNAAMVAAIDLAKTMLAIFVAKTLIGWQWGFVLGSFCAILGHLFPIYYGFKGGKGVLCGLAALLMVDWRVGALVLVVFAIAVLLFKRVSVGSIAACASAPIWCLGLGVSYLHCCHILVIAVWLIWCHRGNIKRLMRGEEPVTVIAKRKKKS